MHASVNVGCQGKSGPGKIHEVILVSPMYVTAEVNAIPLSDFLVNSLTSPAQFSLS